MRGAELALSLAQKAGASFIARCGYMLSEFVARAEGEASAEHRRATALENLVFNAAGHCIVTTGAMKEKVVGYGVPEERRSEEQTSELQSLMRNSYAVFCMTNKNIDEQQKRR